MLIFDIFHQMTIFLSTDGYLVAEQFSIDAKSASETCWDFRLLSFSQ